MTNVSQPVPLQPNHKIYVRQDVPGVPWYIYNDHCNGYYRNQNSNASALVLELAAHPTSGDFRLGGQKLQLPDLSQLIESSGTENVESLTWETFEGMNAWHLGSNETLKDFLGYAARAQPSVFHRTVKLDGEYALQPLGAQSADKASSNTDRGIEVVMKVKSLVGASRMDANMELGGQDNVPDGNGVFRVVLASSGEDGSGWSIIGMDGVECATAS